MSVNTDSFQDYIYCKKSVVMDNTALEAFTKGEKYLATVQKHYITALDNQGEVHGLGTMQDEDRFFLNHFEVVEDDG